ncbi:hypothetical protein, partial [Streptomyces sp. NPDC059786]
MRRILLVLLSCPALAVPAAVATSTAASATPLLASAPSSASPRHDATAPSTRTVACNSGHVCIYKGDIRDGSSDHAKVYDFYYYGTYNVQNLIGDYTVLNCQTGGAGVEGFSGYNGSGSVVWRIDSNNCGTGLWTSLTSTYSVR